MNLKAIRPTDGHDNGDDCYETTEMGAAWVKAICNTAIPKSAFLDEMGRIIE